MEDDLLSRLPVEIMIEVFKRLPIKERVRCECISKGWKAILGDLWPRQTYLQFGEFFSWDNHVGIIKPGRSTDATLIKLTLNIISRCKNVKVLKVYFDVFVSANAAARMATFLNDNCKELEHLDIPRVNLAFFELFMPSKKLTCLLPSNYDYLKVYYDKMNPVKAIRWKLFNNERSPVKPIGLKIVEFWRAEYDIRSLELIDKETVESVAGNDWHDQFNELINLKRLDVANGKAAQIGNFCHLEHIRLFSSSATELVRLFENNRKLSSLIIRDSAEDIIDTLAVFGFDLQRLYIAINKKHVIDDHQFWQNLAKLTELRTLAVLGQLNQELENDCEVDTKLDVNGFILLLISCTKLNYIHLYCKYGADDITTEEEKERIRYVVADRSLAVEFRSSGNDHRILVTARYTHFFVRKFH